MSIKSTTLLVFALAACLAAACSNAELAGAGKGTQSKDDDDDEEPGDIEEDTSESSTPKDEEEAPTGSLSVTPTSARLFKGETVELEATFEVEQADPESVTSRAKWSSGAAAIVTVDAGKVTAVGAGETKVSASFEGAKDSASVTVIKCRDFSAGTKATDVRVKGENYPGNSIDPGGADFDDYFVVIHGDFNVDGFQLSSNVDQDFTVTFSIGSAGSTTQTVELQAVDCDGESTQSANVSGTTGTQSLHAAKGDRFNLVTTAVTGGTARVYDLLKDAGTAFKIVIE